MTFLKKTTFFSQQEDDIFLSRNFYVYWAWGNICCDKDTWKAFWLYSENVHKIANLKKNVYFSHGKKCVQKYFLKLCKIMQFKSTDIFYRYIRDWGWRASVHNVLTFFSRTRCLDFKKATVLYCTVLYCHTLVKVPAFKTVFSLF